MTNLKHVFCANLGAAFLLLAATGSAESWEESNHYRWQNSSGETVFSDQPPPAGVKYDVISAPSRLKPVTSKAAGDVPQDSESKAEESVQNADLCQRAKTNLRMLESPDKVSERDETGELRELSPKERTVMQQTAKAEIDVYCN